MPTEPTPGPWTVIQNTHVNGELWLSIGYLLPNGEQRGPIADVMGENSPRFQPVGELQWLATPEAEQWANAYLLAAAPLMRDVLDDILDYRGGADNALDDEYVMDRARAALAAARGES